MRENKKILVFGASGMLGSTVVKYLQRSHEVLPYTSAGFNIIKHSLSNIEHVLSAVDVIVNCAGIIKPRISTHTPEEVLKVNSLFPRALASYINNEGFNSEDDWDRIPSVIHISSDCVFSGKSGPYSERNISDAVDLYGISKALGEDSNNTTIRTSIIGEEINNKYSLLEWAKSQAGKTISGYTDHRWSGVTTLELAKFIEFMIDEDYDDHGGLTHFVGGTVTKYQLLNIINDVYNLHLNIKMIESGDPIDRSLSTSDRSWVKEFKIKSLDEQLYELKEFYNEG